MINVRFTPGAEMIYMDLDLNEIRKQIDGLDDSLKRDFLDRMALTSEVAEYKREHQLPVTNSSRERDIISRLTLDTDDETSGYIKILFNTLFDVSKAHQRRLLRDGGGLSERLTKAIAETPAVMPKNPVVACQGVEGANSQLACDKLFPRAGIMYVSSFEGVFSAVEAGLCRYGILPIENSLHGSVTEVYDLMKKYSFSIARSVRLKISHALMAKPGTKLSDIREIYSHSQAIAQCSEFLEGLSNVKIIPYPNTAGAAKMASESDPESGVAAIANPMCAGLYGLEVIKSDIANSDNNYTRFICISRDYEIYPGANRVSLMCVIPHRPGSLYGLLSRFAANGVNLLKLESRPIPGRDFEFMFYCDLEASVGEPEVTGLLSDFSGDDIQTTFLGAYSEI